MPRAGKHSGQLIRGRLGCFRACRSFSRAVSVVGSNGQLLRYGGTYGTWLVGWVTDDDKAADNGSGSGSGLDNNGNGGTDVFQGLSPVTVQWRREKVGW